MDTVGSPWFKRPYLVFTWVISVKTRITNSGYGSTCANRVGSVELSVNPICLYIYSGGLASLVLDLKVPVRRYSILIEVQKYS